MFESTLKPPTVIVRKGVVVLSTLEDLIANLAEQPNFILYRGYFLSCQYIIYLLSEISNNASCCVQFKDSFETFFQLIQM